MRVLPVIAAIGAMQLLTARAVAAARSEPPQAASAQSAGSLALGRTGFGDGAKWTILDVKFSPTKQLQSLRMSTRELSFEAVLQLVRSGFEAAPPASVWAGGGAWQARVCDEGAGSVSLTYEPAATPA